MKRKDVVVTTTLSYLFEDDEPVPSDQKVIESAHDDYFGDYTLTIIGESTIHEVKE